MKSSIALSHAHGRTSIHTRTHNHPHTQHPRNPCPDFLLRRNEDTKELVVNFDVSVLELMREGKHLQLMGLEIPNSAKIVLLLENKLKVCF